MLARVAARFPGRRIEVISGYRPSSNPHNGSRHAHARALDFRLVGVAREEVRDFARTLPNAGVGYYPNSVFVHLDVRDPNEGAAAWTDYSGPGERARYGHWPPRADDWVREAEFAVARAERDLAAIASSTVTREERVSEREGERVQEDERDASSTQREENAQTDGTTPGQMPHTSASPEEGGRDEVQRGDEPAARSAGANGTQED